MKRTFSYLELFNLEYFLEQDSSISQDILHERDRKIFLDIGRKDQDDRSLLQWWLKERNCEENNARVMPGPGEIIIDSLRLVAILLTLFGLAIGLSAGLAYFTYTGEAPVNVFHFLILFVFSQFLLLLFIIIATAVRKRLARPRPLSGAAVLYSYLAANIAGRIKRGLSRTISAENRSQYLHTRALIKKVCARHGKMMLMPFFLISQKAMIALNIGVLTATLFKIATSDLAFGWQSTLDISSRALFTVVKALATPWSWLVPENASFPSEKEIEGSRIFLKDGIYHLASSDLTSWWPFLVLCLLCYGLIPRLCLYIIGSALERRRLSRLAPDTPEVLMLLQRMKTPRVSTDGEKNNRRGHPAEETTDPEDFMQKRAAKQDNTVAILLIPEDVREAHGSAELTRLVEKLGYKVVRIETVMTDYNLDRSLFLELAEQFAKEKTTVILMLESWMPPIGDTLSFLRSLSNSLHDSQPYYIGLLAKPEQEEDGEEQVQAMKVWKTRIDVLGDPRLGLLSLGNPGWENRK